MQISNELLRDYLYCKYKGYLKTRGIKGIKSDYELLYGKLLQNQKDNYEKTIGSSQKLLFPNSIFVDPIPNIGISLNLRFISPNINISVDCLEFTGARKVIPIIVSPFEKITKIERLLTHLITDLIQHEFDLKSEACKIVYGKDLKCLKLKTSSILKSNKIELANLNKLLSESKPPPFIKNQHCQICEFQKDCFEKLKERDDISLLAGLKPKEILQKNNRGIFSVKQLSYTFRPRKNPYRKRRFLPELKALAIRDEKTYIEEIPIIKKGEFEVYLDFEGINDRDFIYLIGGIIKSSNSETTFSFWADNDEEELQIFKELIEILHPLKDVLIFHFGSYEIRALNRVIKRLPENFNVDINNIINHSVNILEIFSHKIYPPTYSNGLKEIAGFLNFRWTESNASGIVSTIWRYNWELDPIDHSLKNKLLLYNIEDCMALKHVKEWIYSIHDENEKTKLTSSIKKENIFKWGITNYIVKDFEEINSKAYFDYQREHIFLRTEKKIYKAVKKQKQESFQYNRADKKVNLFPLKCPRCRTKSLVDVRRADKLQIDLVFMNQGIKKRAILYTGGLSICKKCKKSILNANMRRLPMYGNNLMIWSVNQKIQYRQSTEQIINTLKDSFKIEVSATQLTKFKEIIAQKYIGVYKDILNQITENSLIHIDETIARIKGIDGYVWVFTNFDSVYYEFRESRETEFLKSLLNNFHGVLISDFYTGYDGLDCRQQKCLVHLIRDLNEDFLKHQFDSELKQLVIDFGKLLRLIIATIEKFGLKTKNLTKHNKDVAEFYSQSIDLNFESELALSYQKRFLKYKEKLFLFLNYDNIPWNNNNAEHAIKPFAKWRKKISRCLTKQNIENHLILLSILQTCKYRGINFFEFLKSGKMSL